MLSTTTIMQYTLFYTPKNQHKSIDVKAAPKIEQFIMGLEGSANQILVEKHCLHVHRCANRKDVNKKVLEERQKEKEKIFYQRKRKREGAKLYTQRKGKAASKSIFSNFENFAFFGFLSLSPSLSPFPFSLTSIGENILPMFPILIT